MRPLELPPLAHTAIDTLIAPFAYLVALPLTVTYHSLRFAATEPLFPGWTLVHYLAINWRRTYRGLLSWRRVPLRDPEESRIPASSAKYLGTCAVKQVECPPLVEDSNAPSVLKVRRDVVLASPVPGFWVERKSREPSSLDRHASKGERLIFFIVGGGYGGGHPLTIHTPWSLAELSDARVFCINYRKSLSDATAFPCSLLDCMAGFQYVVEEKGFDAQNIMLCGDSAGANGCLALARCLGEMEEMGSTRFGQVGAMCLHSPWGDMTSSFPSIKNNCYTDHLVDLTTSYIPSHTRHFISKSDPYLSPALATMGGFNHLARHKVKVYISAGTAEAFYDEIVALYRGMKRDGVDVELREIAGATHSDFVWLDRDEIAIMGWSWEVLKKDFTRFWAETAA
ncbi:hypothetical protein IAT38_004581 [Cryptococcus sp. DSM 104549]